MNSCQNALEAVAAAIVKQAVRVNTPEARLMALTVRYNRIVMPGTGKVVTAEGLLSSLLLAGSALLIDERMNGIAAALDAAEEKGGRPDV